MNNDNKLSYQIRQSYAFDLAESETKWVSYFGTAIAIFLAIVIYFGEADRVWMFLPIGIFIACEYVLEDYFRKNRLEKILNLYEDDYLLLRHGQLQKKKRFVRAVFTAFGVIVFLFMISIIRSKPSEADLLTTTEHDFRTIYNEDMVEARSSARKDGALSEFFFGLAEVVGAMDAEKYVSKQMSDLNYKSNIFCSCLVTKKKDGSPAAIALGFMGETYGPKDFIRFAEQEGMPDDLRASLGLIVCSLTGVIE